MKVHETAFVTCAYKATNEELSHDYVLLGPIFRISYGSSKEVASFTGVCTVLNDGIRYCNDLSKEVCPVEIKSVAVTTSIGNGDVVLLLGAVLDPTKTTS